MYGEDPSAFQGQHQGERRQQRQPEGRQQRGGQPMEQPQGQQYGASQAHTQQQPTQQGQRGVEGQQRATQGQQGMGAQQGTQRRRGGQAGTQHGQRGMGGQQRATQGQQGMGAQQGMGGQRGTSGQARMQTRQGGAQGGMQSGETRQGMRSAGAQQGMQSGAGMQSAGQQTGGFPSAGGARPQSVSLDEVSRGEVVTVEPDETITNVAVEMADKDVGSVVVTRDGEPVGVLTDRKIALTLGEMPGVADRTAGDLVSEGVVTGDPGMTIYDAVQMLRDEGVRRLPIVDDEGELDGIVTLDDIIVLVAGELGAAAEVIEKQAPPR